jgi:hypothetical protein
MNAKVVRAGIAAGIAGGAVMAVFSMMMLWLAGSGFWTPLNLIAHALAGRAAGRHVQRPGTGHRHGRAHDDGDAVRYPDRRGRIPAARRPLAG